MKKYYSINVELTCGFSYMCDKTLIYDEIPEIYIPVNMFFKAISCYILGKQRNHIFA